MFVVQEKIDILNERLEAVGGEKDTQDTIDGAHTFKHTFKKCKFYAYL